MGAIWQTIDKAGIKLRDTQITAEMKDALNTVLPGAPTSVRLISTSPALTFKRRRRPSAVSLSLCSTTLVLPRPPLPPPRPRLPSSII